MLISLRTFTIPFILILGFFSFNPALADLDIITIDSGLLSGTLNKDGDVHIFKGIPFAAPPVGELRWKAPQPVIPWQGIKKSENFGPSPMQNKPAPFSMWTQEFLIPEEPISEDCLYLNVWSGADSESDNLPVLVWIYGGGFNSGGSAVPIYDGEAMAKRGIVFVSINYRVGIFGFFAYPELTRESGRNASGNYGLMDQIAALEWVQRNISAFGGDPKNVTIAGQSAGSMSVNALVASPLAKNLFHRAIGQSGANFSRGSLSLKQAEEDGLKIANALNASNVQELRNKPAEELLKQAQGMRGPIIDGYVLPEPIADIFKAGKQNKVDLLTGWNEDEGLIFGPVKNAADFRKSAEEQYGTEAQKLLQFYPATNDSIAAHSQLILSRDMIFGVQNYTWANVQSKQGNSNVYVYRFTRKVPATGEYVKYGAFHTGEVPYALFNLQFVDRPWEAVDHELALAMSNYWVNFITSGNPNDGILPEWPAYDTEETKLMIFGKEIEAKELPDQEALDFMVGMMKRK